MKQKHYGAAALIMSGILWGLISIFINPLSEYGLVSQQITLIRLATAALFFFLYVLIFDRKKLKIDLKDIWMFIGTGIISVVLFNLCYFYTIVHSQVSVAVVLLYTSPAFVMLLSAILFKEKITPLKITALALTVAGCALTAGILGGGYDIAPLILLSGLGSGFFYSLYTIFGKYALKKYDSTTVTVYTFIFGFIGLLPFGKPFSAVKTALDEPKIWLWGIGIGIFCTLLPYFLYTWGLRSVEPGKASILCAVEPMVGTLVGITMFNEKCETTKILGIVCIVAAIVLLNVKPKEKKGNVQHINKTHLFKGKEISIKPSHRI